MEEALPHGGIQRDCNQTELCTCMVLREEKEANAEERKKRRVVPEGSRRCIVREYTPGKGSRWLRASPPTCRAAVLSQALLGSSTRCAREVGRPHHGLFC